MFFRRVLLILDMHVVAHGSEIGEKIGFPTQYSDNDSSVTPSASASTSKMNGSSSLKTYTNESTNASTTVTTNINVGDINGSNTHPISSLSPYHNK